MLRQLSRILVVLCGMISMEGLAEERPAFDLQAPEVLLPDSSGQVLLMNNTSRTLRLKFALTAFQSPKPEQQAQRYEFLLLSANEKGTLAEADLETPVELKPGAVKRLFARLSSTATPTTGDYVGYIAAYEDTASGHPHAVLKPLTLSVPLLQPAPKEKVPLKTLLGGELKFAAQCNLLPWTTDCTQSWPLEVNLAEDSQSKDLSVPVFARLIGANGHSVLARMTLDEDTRKGAAKPEPRGKGEPPTRTITFEFARIAEPGTYTATVGDDNNKVSLVLSVAQHPGWLFVMMVLGVVLYVITRRLAVWGKLERFLSGCIALRATYRDQQQKYQEALGTGQDEGLKSARNYDLETDLHESLESLMNEARRLSRSKLFLGDGDSLPTEAFAKLKKAVEGWSGFGSRLAELHSRMRKAKAQPPPFLSRTSPRLFDEARKLLVGSPLSLADYEQLRQQVDEKLEQVKAWTELNAQTKQLLEVCDLLAKSTLSPEQTSLLKLTQESLMLVWISLWERPQHTKAVDDQGHTVEQLLDAALNAVSKLRAHLNAPPPPKEPSFESPLTGPDSDVAIVPTPPNRSAKLMELKQARLRNGYGTAADWALILITAAVSILIYYRDTYSPTWGTTWTDYVAALTAGYSAQALVAVVGSVLYREPAVKLLDFMPLRK